MSNPSTQECITRYGRTWPAGWNLLDIELTAFRLGLTPAQGGLGKANHFKNVVNSLWGPEVKAPSKFIWHPWAEDMLEASCQHRYLGLAGARSVGKTRWGAIWAIVNYLAAPRNTMVLVCSTSLKEARKRIWGDIREYWLGSAGRLPGKLVDSIGQIKFPEIPGIPASDKCGITLVAADKSQSKEASAKLIGMKNQRVILIVDEMTDISEAVLEAAKSNLESNYQPERDPDSWFQIMGLGNPSSYYDAFGILITPKRGWGTIHADMDEWETELGHCLRFDGEKSPNVLAGAAKYPVGFTVNSLREERERLGPSTVAYWRMVRGFFCPTGAEQAVFSEPDIEQYKGRDGVVWEGEPTRIAGLDPAYTNGGDQSVLFFGRWGAVAGGGNCLLLDEFVELREDVTKTDEPRNFQIARKFREECEKRGVKPEHAAFDATGAGGPFGDIVSQVWSPRVLRVHFGGAPTDRPVSEFNPQPSNEFYLNRVTEIWYSGMEFLKHGQLKGITPELARELCSRFLSTRKQGGLKLCVESKTDMKARIGKSPDKADAAMILVDLVRERFKGTRTKATGRRSSGWKGVLRRVGSGMSEGLRGE